MNLLIIPTISFLILAGMACVIAGNQSKNEFVSGFGLAWMISAVILVAMLALINEVFEPTRKAYRLGQINAICGKIEYERVVEPDSTIVWKRIDRKKK